MQQFFIVQIIHELKGKQLMDEKQNILEDFIERIEESFTSVDYLLCANLYVENENYRELCTKTDNLDRDNWIIREVLEKNNTIRCSAKDHEKLLEYISLQKEMDEIVHRHIHNQGYKDGFAHSKEIDMD